MNSHDKLKLVRLPKQVGLMGARQSGADIATGDTLTFLDSHIEASKGLSKQQQLEIYRPVVDNLCKVKLMTVCAYYCDLTVILLMGSNSSM